jgi:hypothetical protein
MSTATTVEKSVEKRFSKSGKLGFFSFSKNLSTKFGGIFHKLRGLPKLSRLLNPKVFYQKPTYPQAPISSISFKYSLKGI